MRAAGSRAGPTGPRLEADPVRGYLTRVDDGRTLLCRFAASLDDLRAADGPDAVERCWQAGRLERLGRDALAVGRRAGSEALLGPLEEVDRKLLAALRRLRRLNDTRIATFRIPALERMQHAAAAAVTGSRWGVAGLHTVIADRTAPLGRRYFAFLALAERHPPDAWPFFERVLDTPTLHHAFLAAAADAARYYGGTAAAALVALFHRIRRDDHLRRFLGPHILESLLVVGGAEALALARELLIAGHTARDPERCEITRALVIVRRFTGSIEPSAKYADPDDPDVADRLNAAEALFERKRDEIASVVLI